MHGPKLLRIRQGRNIPWSGKKTRLITTEDSENDEVTVQEVNENGNIEGTSIFSKYDPDRPRFEEIYRRTHRFRRR